MARQIEIRTAQQVTLSYDLAGAGLRILSTLIDWGILLIIGLFIFRALDNSLFAKWLSFIVVTFYHLIAEIVTNGRSPGKILTGIRVMRTDGAPLEMADLFLRWIIRPLDLTFSLGILALFVVNGTQRRQRLGDLMAGTVVITKKHSSHYNYTDLMKLHVSRTGTSINFPQLRHLEEKHILFIKNLLSSHEMYSAGAYRNALKKCAEHLASLLQLEKTPTNHREFLQKLVQEYIILTR
jgi:uncharacterized RDD family membrane protein YckC